MLGFRYSRLTARRQGVFALALGLVLAVAPLGVAAGLAWDVAGAVCSGRSADLSGHTADARTVEFSPDGARMYVVGRGTQNVAEYHLAVPWNIETARHHQNLRITATNAHGLFFNPANGMDMYVFNRTEVQQYRLTEAWNVATAERTAVRVMEDEHVRMRRGHDIHFNPDGTRFYVEDRDLQRVFQYTLDTPWQIGSMRWAYTLDIADQEQAVRGIMLHPEGVCFWLMDTQRREVLQYQMDPPWELAGARFDCAFDVSAQAVNPRGFVWRVDGRAFFVTGTTHQRLYEYVILDP